jgi:hypothetical protein
MPMGPKSQMMPVDAYGAVIESEEEPSDDNFQPGDQDQDQDKSESDDEDEGDDGDEEKRDGDTKKHPRYVNLYCIPLYPSSYSWY